MYGSRSVGRVGVGWLRCKLVYGIVVSWFIGGWLVGCVWARF